MALCTVRTGFLFWKKICGKQGTLRCLECSLPMCPAHTRNEPGRQLCVRCNPSDDTDSESGSSWSWSWGSSDSSGSGDFSSSSTDSGSSSSDSGSSSSSSD